MRILLVEDNPFISRMIIRGLTEQLYAVDHAQNGEQGLELALTNDYDLIILDIVLPGKDGLAVCRAIRKEGVTVPILMLTSLADDTNVIQGLDAGADDYLAKPFNFGVLFARVRSLIRRQSKQKTNEIRIGDLVLDAASRRVMRNGVAIELTAKELMLLEYLMRNEGEVVTRDMISEHVWDMNFDPNSNVVDSLVRRLRQKVDRNFRPPLIQTIRGIGYRIGAS